MPETPAVEAPPPVVIVTGPTAGGKSGLALELAEAFDGVVINADSMQVYRGMSIGTAKPPRRDRMRIPHHLIDVLSPGKTFSVHEYRRLALERIRGITKRGRIIMGILPVLRRHARPWGMMRARSISASCN